MLTHPGLLGICVHYGMQGRCGRPQ